MAHVKAGRVKLLAVTTAQRSTLVPDTPATAGSGLPGDGTVAWSGLFAPAGTPPEIVNRRATETARVATLPEMQKTFETLGGEAAGAAPAEFGAQVKRDIAKRRKVVADGNIRVD